MMNIIRIAALSLVVINSTVTNAQNFDTVKLDRYFQTLNDNNKFMGSVSVFRNGVEIYSKSVGLTDINSTVSYNELSKCCVGSISKMITAVMVFQAIEAGKLSLSATLDTYFPSIKNAKETTIAHLLGHRSGIHNYTDNGNFMKWPAKTREQMVDIITAGGSDFEPDSTADYSNSGYVLLSYILEDIYKKSYSDILMDQIIRSLSLENTSSGKNTINISNNECNSYLYLDEWKLQTVTDPSVTLGAGCIVSTPEDLNKFADALFNGRLISDSSLSIMQNIRDGYGMGMFLVPYFSKQGYGHRGGVDGFSSMLIYMPEDKISYAITSNGLNYNFTEIHAAVLNCIYNEPFDIPNFDKVTIKREILEKYTGTYSNDLLALKVSIIKDRDSLSAQIEGQPSFPLEVASEHVFRFKPEDTVIEFNPSNESMILIQGENIFYFSKITHE